jgi:hypothetical protein
MPAVTATAEWLGPLPVAKVYLYLSVFEVNSEGDYSKSFLLDLAQ